ncbi:MAG TPA: cation:proton antiporter [Candidatus Omnitrophica bacterium]|nr:cation:proton antiporter [Candidatus Omnitrophota bacterium]
MSEMNIVFALGVLLLVGYFSGRVARKFRLPEISGYILAGVLIGPSGFNLIPEEILVKDLSWVVDITLGLIAFSIGGSLNLARIRRLEKSITLIAFFESLYAFLLVSISILVFSPFIFKSPDLSHLAFLPFSIVLGSIASATAPAATLTVVNEYKARGPLTTTLLGVVALDDAIAIILFGLCMPIASSISMGIQNSIKVFAIPLVEILGSFLFGIVLGFFLRTISRYLKTNKSYLIVVLGAVCLASGVSMILKLSPLLTNMALGFVIVNSRRRDLRFIHVLDNFTPPFYAIFFALAGTYLKLAVLFKVGVLGLVFIVARALGKIAGASFGGGISKAKGEVRKFLGFALIPEAGVAVGLVIMATQSPALEMYRQTMINIILAAVAVNELIGPPATAFALRHAGETNI